MTSRAHEALVYLHKHGGTSHLGSGPHTAITAELIEGGFIKKLQVKQFWRAEITPSGINEARQRRRVD